MVQHALCRESGPILLLLKSEFGLDENHGQWLCEFGAVYLNHQRLKDISSEAQKGDYIRVHTFPRRFPVSDIKWLQTIIYQQNEFVVINKPAGIPTHPTVDNLHENAAYQLSQHLQTPIYVTHRLDVATQGILFLAKAKTTQREFNLALQQGRVEKTYVAQVQGDLAFTGLVEHYMEPSAYLPKRLSKIPVNGWQKCLLEILSYQRRSSIPSTKKMMSQESPTEGKEFITEVHIRLITGRTHQIRAQLANLGYPILGDPLYVNTDLPIKTVWGSIEKIALAAQSLKVEIPELGLFHFHRE